MPQGVAAVASTYQGIWCHCTSCAKQLSIVLGDNTERPKEGGGNSHLTANWRKCRVCLATSSVDDGIRLHLLTARIIASTLYNATPPPVNRPCIHMVSSKGPFSCSTSLSASTTPPQLRVLVLSSGRAGQLKNTTRHPVSLSVPSRNLKDSVPHTPRCSKPARIACVGSKGCPVLSAGS